MEAYLSKTFYSNTLLDWGTAFAIIIGAVLLAKALYWFFGSIARQLSKKSKTKLDDIIIDMVEEPVVFVVIVFGVWYGINSLTLPNAVTDWIEKIVHVLIVFSVAWLVTRLFDALFREYITPLSAKSDSDLDDQILPIVLKAIKITVWAFAFIIALSNAGYDVTALIAGLGIGGLALAMAAKDSVSNIFGGMTVFMDRPFKLGDRIRVAGFDGSIDEIGIRTTRLRTLEGRLVSIPNSTFSGSAVENVSREPHRKVVSNLGLTYDTTPDKMAEAMAILKRLAGNNEHLEEKCVVSFNSFGDSAMNILFIYYIKKGHDISGTQTEMNMSILGEFTAAGLEFAFPTQTLYTKSL